ncbi:hypothetical protein AYO21_06019 [Fonsecaea monophora]|uniref:Major facilitator superfamily (MFS) profile domain-containing protein n=1 Tax=Fonsecaea monophora TaxID=254056 RepID=A0A177F6A9_9EURO|nr:hypothetical protein AYO21_06019 [Fonsecaea monophora]OAG39744.1 hypothetical protein AYO21_06019 [Fonsecaea monophora]
MQKYQLLCIIFVTFGSFFYGYDSGCTTSVLGYSSFIEYFDLNATTIGAFGSAYYGGGAVGCFLNYYLPDKFGRLRTIQASCVLGLIGSAMQAGATNFPVFCTGRVITGIATGTIFSVCPTYASEIATPEIRGRVGSLYAFNVNFAYMLTEWVGLGFYYIKGNAAWRTLLGLQLAPAAFMLVASFWMPFSPRWLIMKGREDEALEVLRKLHEGVEGYEEDFYVKEFHQIKTQYQIDKANKLGLVAIFKKKSYRKRMYLILLFVSFCQFTGIIPLQNYQVTIYTKLGFTNVFSLILTGIWGTLGCLSTITASQIVDRLGRRHLMFVSYSFMIPGGILLVALWASFEATHSTNFSLGKAVIFGMFFYGFGYGGFMNTFFPVYCTEIMPTNIRATGTASGYALFNLIVIMLVQVTPMAIEAISWKYFMIFVICDVVFIVIFILFYPETKNKTLEEISAIFGDEVAETLEEAGQHVSEVLHEHEHDHDHEKAAHHVDHVAVKSA